MKPLTLDTAPPIIRIIRDSKINGAQYDGDKLQPRPWVWPTQTWLQRKLAEKAQESKP